jgi:hypothetical protein
VRLAKGIAGVFAMCRSRAIEESLHRHRTEVLHEDFCHYTASMGHPLPPRSPPPLTPAYPENLNEWHQQEYGVPFVTPEDEAEEFDDSFYTSAPPPPYLGPGPIPGDPRPSGYDHFPPPPYQSPGPIPGDPRPSGSGHHHHASPYQGPSSSSGFPSSDKPPLESSFGEDMMCAFFSEYPFYPPSGDY